MGISDKDGENACLPPLL